MKFAIAALLAFTSLHAAAGESITLQGVIGGGRAAEEEAAKPRTVEVRAIQVNRCVDARGKVTLSDQPCTPLTSASTAAAEAAPPPPVEVVELSAMQPRPAREVPQRAVEDAPMSAFTKGVLHGSWKLLLLVVGIYALVRLGLHARDRYRQKYGVAEPVRQGPLRIR